MPCRRIQDVEKINIEKELLAIYGKLWRYAYYLTQDNDRADDLMQETALKVLVNRNKYRCNKNFENWVRAIMHNAYLNIANREKKLFAVDEFREAASYGLGYQAIESDNTVNEENDIYNAVNRLPEVRRETMTMLIRGHKYDEIAFVMNVPLGTVKSRVSNSRVILKEVLKDYIN